MLLMMGLLVGVAPEPIDVAAVSLLQRYQHVTRSRWPNQVEEAVLQVLARRPLDPQPWRTLGDIYFNWGRSDDALYAYGQATRRNDDSNTLKKGLAQLYASLDDPRKAAQYWQDYLLRSPEDGTARLALALTHIRLARWQQAQAELERLLNQDANLPVVHAWLGLIHLETEPALGLYHLTQAIKDRTLAELLTPILTTERQMALSDNPAYRSAVLGLSLLELDSVILARLSQLEPDAAAPVTAEPVQKTMAVLALRSLLIAVTRNPEYADAYAYIGQTLDLLGWSGWAQIALRQALQLAPESPIVKTALGLYWDRHGSPGLARHYYEAAYSQNPDSAVLCLEIASTYAAEGQYTAAEIWLLYAIEIAPEDATAWESLSRFYLESGIGIKESGLYATTRLLELTPDAAQAHELMGRAYFLLEEHELARASLEQALSLDPTLASAHYYLGRLNARQERYAEAAAAYQQAGALDGDRQLTAELERAREDLFSHSVPQMTE